MIGFAVSNNKTDAEMMSLLHSFDSSENKEKDTKTKTTLSTLLWIFSMNKFNPRIERSEK